MKKTIYGALAATILALGACGGSGGEAAEPVPTAPIPDDTAAAGDTEATEATPAAETTPAEEATPAAPAAPAATVTDAELDQAFGLMQAMAKNATDTKGDCKAMAAGFDKLFTDSAGLIKKMNSMQDDKGLQAKWDAKYKGESEKLMMGMMGDIGECMKDPDLQAAMAKMGGA